ncbi:MAG TPA: peptide chain release factor N(5)-glutamine methyltransferase [Sedimenticola sp.]|nr:peptide chain release factor N(5)-glutamine methyltransferase [Sedimenticola sp.]
MTRPTIREALREAGARLASRAGAAPRLEAEILLGLALDKPRSHLHAWPDKALRPQQQTGFRDLIERRSRGEPIAYITGRREFWSLELRVTPDTLIPRPETERLVERALELTPEGRPLRIADLGTGCGAIAAAIASERPRCRITATDRCAAALRVAEANFRRLGLTNITPESGEWCAALPRDEGFDLILSNPPYVPDGDPHLERGDLPWEPRDALAAGPDGLSEIRRIIGQAPSHLVPGGWLLLEHGCDQGAGVRELLAGNGFESIDTLRDLAGRERITEGRIRPHPA